MKKALSILLAFVFLQVQLWASGGPNYGSLNNSVSGTWAGTLIGSVGSNGLGLFELGIPQTGLGSGTFAFFVTTTATAVSGGGAFFGTVVALADGQKSRMSGIFKGSLQVNTFFLTINLTTGAVTSTPTVLDEAEMGGQFVAKITGNTGGTTAIGVGARLTGTATASVGLVNGFTSAVTGITPGITTLTVDGFEQSQQVSGTVSLNSITGTTPSGGGGS